VGTAGRGGRGDVGVTRGRRRTTSRAHARDEKARGGGSITYRSQLTFVLWDRAHKLVFDIGGGRGCNINSKVRVI
jgi:hypothetical protein